MEAIESIKNRTPYVFTKYGDGEYFASIYKSGHNCDRTPYTRALGDSVTASFKYLSSQKHVYLGQWGGAYGADAATYFTSLVDHPINWVPFESFIMRHITNNKKIDIYRTIRNATQKKIYICNEELGAIVKPVLKIDEIVHIHPSDWFQQSFNDTLNTTINSIHDPSDTIILISGGMGAKSLIAEMHKIYNSLIIIDIGSALDFLKGTGKETRDYQTRISSEITEFIRLIGE